LSRAIAPAPIRKTLAVRAPREKAFRVFTEGFDRWWPRSHTIGQAPLARAVLECRLGGRWFGIDENGHEDDWGEVLVWEPPARILLAWRVNAKWAYDPKVATEVELTFADLGDGTTRVDFEHRHLERLGEGAAATAAQLGGGWPTLLDLYRELAET
jgi:uncharacterized protein YndB with AHSA1/START domain